MTNTIARALMGTALSTLIALPATADIRFWTTEEQPERLERQQQLAADFEA